MRTFLLLLVCIFGCAGCVAYTYDNVSYNTREAAFAAARHDVERNVAGVATAGKKIGGKLLVVVPTRDIIVQYGVRKTGNVSADVVAYVADVVEIGFVGMGDAVRKAQLFDSVTIIRSSNTERAAFDGYDYKLWLLGLGQEQWQWYLSKRGLSFREPVTGDRAFKRTELLNSFNAMLVRAAALLEVRNYAESGKQPGREASRKKGEVVSSGSGFFINAAGFALTNAHVIDNCGSLRASLREGEGQPVTLVAADRENDLALIKVPSRIRSYAQFRAGPPVRQGESIVTYGYPLAGLLASHGNLGTGVISALAGMGDDSGEIQISAPIQPGNSGGPVLDAGGNVVGVVRAKLNSLGVAKVTGDIAQNVNFAVKVSMVTSFLEVNNIKYDTAPLKKEATTADIADKAKEFTFIVQCVE